MIDSEMLASDFEVKRPFKLHRSIPISGFLDLHEVVNRLGSLRFPECWGDPAHRDLPMFLFKGNPHKYAVKNGKTERLPIPKLSSKRMRLRKNAAIRYKKLVFEIVEGLQTGKLTAHYVVPKKPDPVRISASHMWVEQGKLIFTTGRIWIDHGGDVEKNYRVVIRQRSFSMWINPGKSTKPKLSAFKGKISSELRELLTSIARRHGVSLTKARTWGLVREALPAGPTKVSFFSNVFNLLPAELKQAKEAPLKKDRTSFETDLKTQLATFAATHFPSSPK